MCNTPCGPEHVEMVFLLFCSAKKPVEIVGQFQVSKTAALVLVYNINIIFSLSDESPPPKAGTIKVETSKGKASKRGSEQGGKEEEGYPGCIFVITCLYLLVKLEFFLEVYSRLL